MMPRERIYVLLFKIERQEEKSPSWINQEGLFSSGSGIDVP
jgi:hypothetical protein